MLAPKSNTTTFFIPAFPHSLFYVFYYMLWNNCSLLSSAYQHPTFISANYKAVRCLSLTTLNSKRGSILLQNFMKNGQVLSPLQVSKMEHIFPSLANPWSSSNGISLHRRVFLGIKVSLLKHHDMVELSGSTISHYKKVKYLLLERKGVVRAIIHKQATPADILQSFIHALVLASLTEQSKAAHTESRLWIEEYYNDFITKLHSAGWEVERLLTPSIVWRAEWDHVSVEEKIK